MCPLKLLTVFPLALSISATRRCRMSAARSTRAWRLSPEMGAIISVASTAITTIPTTIAKSAKPGRRPSAAMDRHVIAHGDRGCPTWREADDGKSPASEGGWLISFHEGCQRFRVGERDVGDHDSQRSGPGYA